MKLNPNKKKFGEYARLVVVILFINFTAFAQDEDENFIVPVRPSVSESANIHKKGVLQIETGGDFDFNAPDYRNVQSNSLGVYFAATKKLRLDFELETIASQKDRMNLRKTGIGDLSLGFKVIIRDKPEKRVAVAFSYSVKLPTASAKKGLGTGKVDHNLRAIFDRSYGKNDFIVNVSYLNVGREISNRRASGTQVILRYDRELTKKVGVITEYFGNTVNEEQPRGLYILSALTYRVNKRLRLDGGGRAGFGRAAPNFNFFFGLSFGAVEASR